MNSINILGRLGQDPEAATYGTDGKLCKFSVAVNKRRRNGEEQPPSWFNVTVFGKPAENCLQYLKKGREVTVTGRMESTTRDKDGTKVTYWDLIAENVDFVGPNPEAQVPAGVGATDEGDIGF